MNNIKKVIKADVKEVAGLKTNASALEMVDSILGFTIPTDPDRVPMPTLPELGSASLEY